jgi:hypothetical protein
MKKSFLLLFYILIIIFIGFLLYFFFFKKNIEAFTVNSITSSATSAVSSATSSVGYYDYLTRLPSDNEWSSSTKKALLDYMNSNLISKQPNATPMKQDASEFVTFLNQYQPFATDNEVTYYINNDKWPWDGYINDFIKNTTIPTAKKYDGMTDDQIDEALKNYQKIATNRQVYVSLIMNKTVPQIAIVNQLNQSGFSPTQNVKLECVFLRKGEQTQNDGTKINIDNEGKYLSVNGNYVLDDNAWTNYIPGFVFQSKPCNVCDIINYTDMNNKCLFTIETSDAFKKYMGDNSLTTSSNAITSTSNSMESFDFGGGNNDGQEDNSDTKNNSDTKDKSSSSSSWF